MSARHRIWLAPLLVGSVMLIFDQLSKSWILQNLGPIPLQKRMPILVSWIELTYHRNTGVAFSMFQDMSSLFIFTSLLIGAGAIYAYLRWLPHQRVLMQICLGLILSGGLGNTLDRIRLGFVVDFIHIGWWPIFNVADSAISTGVVLLGIYLIFFDTPALHEVSSPQDTELLGDLLKQDTGSMPIITKTPDSTTLSNDEGMRSESASS